MNALLILLLVFGPTFGFVEQSLTDLTTNMLSSLTEKMGNDENILFSPSSIFFGVGMLYLGMDGNTREAVRGAMNFPEDEKMFNMTMMEFTKPTNPSAKFTANMITVSKDAKVKKDFAVSVVNLFHANPFVQDFGKDPERTRKSINIWVARRTNNKIKGLMPPGSVQADTRVVLVNALYFKSDWEESFDNDLVRDSFTSADGVEQTVDMMTGKKFVSYGKFNDAEVISMPFADEDFKFVVVLPKEGTSANDLPDDLKDSNIMEAVTHPTEKLEGKTALITMPKFKVEMNAELTSLLKTIPGLDRAVSSTADYSMMSEKPIKVGDVRHKAVIDVIQTGVEAAAATSIAVIPYANFPADIEITLSRPFLYLIVEEPKGAIHMAGILNNPKNENL